MNNMSNWVLGFSSAVMAISALFVAARAGDGVGYYGGLAMFLFCVAFVFHLVRTTMDHEDASLRP